MTLRIVLVKRMNVRKNHQLLAAATFDRNNTSDCIERCDQQHAVKGDEVTRKTPSRTDC